MEFILILGPYQNLLLSSYIEFHIYVPNDVSVTINMVIAITCMFVIHLDLPKECDNKIHMYR